MAISPTARIHTNVQLGEGAEVGDFVIIGEPPRGKASGEVKTIIGKGAVIRSHTVIYAGNVIGDRFQTGHGTLVREDNTIGNDVSIGSASIVEHHVVIEDGARIHSQAFVPEFSRLGEKCWIGPRVVITNARYPVSRGVKDSLQGATVGRRAKIGANATLLPGVVIGDDALVGAGAVVTKSVPNEQVVVGNPARVVNSVRNIEGYGSPPPAIEKA
jgi:acetyltransferase-like isoleucine patch superfamily enzyme